MSEETHYKATQNAGKDREQETLGNSSESDGGTLFICPEGCGQVSVDTSGFGANTCPDCGEALHDDNKMF